MRANFLCCQVGGYIVAQHQFARVQAKINGVKHQQSVSTFNKRQQGLPLCAPVNNFYSIGKIPVRKKPLRQEYAKAFIAVEDIA